MRRKIFLFVAVAVIATLSATAPSFSQIRTTIWEEADKQFEELDNRLSAYLAARAEVVTSFAALKKAVDAVSSSRVDVQERYGAFLAKRRAAIEKRNAMAAANLAATDLMLEKVFPCVYGQEKVRKECVGKEMSGRYQVLEKMTDHLMEVQKKSFLQENEPGEREVRRVLEKARDRLDPVPSLPSPRQPDGKTKTRVVASTPCPTGPEKISSGPVFIIPLLNHYALS